MRDQWLAVSRARAVRPFLVTVGWLLILISPVVGPIPGPGGIIVFAAGLSLVLRNSAWAKRKYAQFKRRHPNKGAWADWGLRRQSAIRRTQRDKALQAAEAPLDD